MDRRIFLGGGLTAAGRTPRPSSGVAAPRAPRCFNDDRGKTPSRERCSLVTSEVLAIRLSTPTPTGRFAVTDKLSGPRYGGYFGCCILALSGTQPHLPPGWRGGNRLAIHGTDRSGTIGRRSSAGCLRAGERPLRALMRDVPLGTPVEIRR